MKSFLQMEAPVIFQFFGFKTMLVKLIEGIAWLTDATKGKEQMKALKLKDIRQTAPPSPERKIMDYLSNKKHTLL